MKYRLRCNNGHLISLDASGFQSVLEEDDAECDQCGEKLELEHDVALVCQICSMTYEAKTLEEANLAASEPCIHCRVFEKSAFFRVPGSHAEDIGEYEWSRSSTNPKRLARIGRKDYWEGLIHFCNRDQFISILKDGKIKANPTGYFKSPAVCLTETPSHDCAELKKTHGDYGLIFQKKELIQIGGNPALYLGSAMINEQLTNGGFATAVKPFVNLLRTPGKAGFRPYNFLHEREWRVLGNIEIKQIKPFGIILPEGTGRRRFRGKDGELILLAARMYNGIQGNNTAADLA
jgi:hypothetical protein